MSLTAGGFFLYNLCHNVEEVKKLLKKLTYKILKKYSQ